MNDPHERRAKALEAIAHALLDLAAVEREPEDAPPREVLINRRNCEAELGLAPSTFMNAAGRRFPAFRVSKRVTATKADVLAWLKTRKVTVRTPTMSRTPATDPDPDAFLTAVQGRFVARVARVMTDEELYQADVYVAAGRAYRRMFGGEFTETPDEIARHMQSAIGTESLEERDWRSLGLDHASMKRDAEAVRHRLRETQPAMGWRERVAAVHEMWSVTTGPLREARKAARAATRAAKKAERAKLDRPKR
jgi:hypothetical protein